MKITDLMVAQTIDGEQVLILRADYEDSTRTVLRLYSQRGIALENTPAANRGDCIVVSREAIQCVIPRS